MPTSVVLYIQPKLKNNVLYLSKLVINIKRLFIFNIDILLYFFIFSILSLFSALGLIVVL